MPGGRLNDRNVKMAMRRMGMTTEELSDVEEVIIRRAREEIVIKKAAVTVITLQGTQTYQIVGDPQTRARGIADGSPAAAVTTPNAPAFPEDDVKLVMEQGNVGRDQAMAALTEAHGEPAEAILKIISKRGP